MVLVYSSYVILLSNLCAFVVVNCDNKLGRDQDVHKGPDLDLRDLYENFDFDQWFQPDSEGGQNHHKKDSGVKPAYLFSPLAMKKLVASEAMIYNKMKNYVEKIEKRLDLMKRYIKDYEESSIKGTAHIAKNETVMEFNMSAKQQHAIVFNPLITHRMIRRFAVNFVEIVNSFKSYSEDDFSKTLSDLEGELLYPNVDDDYMQSIESLLRIQLYNNFQAKQLADGKLGHITSTAGLGPVHAFEIGTHSANNDCLAIAIEWMEVALAKISKDGDENDKFLSEIIWKRLAEIVKTHDHAMKAWNEVNDLCFTDFIGADFGPHLPKRQKTSELKRKEAARLRDIEEYGSHTKSNFLSLCSGISLKTEKEKSRLSCWLDTKKHPYWSINPLKVELLNEDPPLIQIYELLDPKTIQKVINVATPTLQRSEVINYDNPAKSDISSVRTSSQTWLQEERLPFFENIMKKIEFVTGLNVRKWGASETIQVASYGTSHHYDEHLDAMMDERRTAELGDRIATFMFYLTDVEVGGKTAFPVMGTAANPVAGSAVFWHNLKLNGEPDKRTWHGGCPVVLGNKWVANKWILLHENWDKRKCSLSFGD